MKNKKYINLIIFTILLFCSKLYSETFFSGFTGIKGDINFTNAENKFDPQLNLQSYFSGQFNFSTNIIFHSELSLKTSDILENSIFKESPAEFQIDELSLTFRSKGLNSTNYFNIFAGTFEPIGSDVFLRRHFGIKPVMSKICESWLGLAGSVIYPLFGVGISDTVHFSNQPIALGTYIYINKEIDDFYVFNADLRFSGVYRFFIFDISGGIGTPLQYNSNDESLLTINKIYWRTGLNMLIGNNYTTSLFIQAGISDVPFTKTEKTFSLDPEKTYILIEPRFYTKQFNFNLTLFSLPQETVNDFIFINDTLGINANVYTNNLYLNNKMYLFGINTGISFPNKTFLDILDYKALLSNNNIVVAPYIETGFYNGTIHSMLKIKMNEILKLNMGQAFSLSIGYKTQI